MAIEPDETRTDRPYPARKGRLVRDLADVTPEWLTGLLAHRYPGIVVNGFEVIELNNGFTTKLRLAWDLNAVGKAAGIPERICLKANWSEGFESGEITELEARFYHFMRDQVSIPLTRTWYADWDGDGGGRGIVAMEDLGDGAGRFGHSGDHLGVDGVAKALETLAVLHGCLWDSPKLDAQAWLHPSMDTPVDSDQLLRGYNYIALNVAKAEYRAFLPAWMLETPERFSFAFDELAAYELEQDGPRCLVHGDSHQGNSFVRPDGQRGWHDWQLVRKGRPWRDVTYFMLGSLTVEERRASARDLIRHYREALKATGAQGVPDQDAAWEQFRRWPVYGMQSWLANQDAWAQDNGARITERFWRAAEDMETIEVLTRGKTPRRTPRLGVDLAREIAPGLRRLMEEGA